MRKHIALVALGGGSDPAQTVLHVALFGGQLNPSQIYSIISVRSAKSGSAGNASSANSIGTKRVQPHGFVDTGYDNIYRVTTDAVAEGRDLEPLGPKLGMVTYRVLWDSEAPESELLLSLQRTVEMLGTDTGVSVDYVHGVDTGGDCLWEMSEDTHDSTDTSKHVTSDQDLVVIRQLLSCGVDCGHVFIYAPGVDAPDNFMEITKSNNGFYVPFGKRQCTKITKFYKTHNLHYTQVARTDVLIGKTILAFQMAVAGYRGQTTLPLPQWAIDKGWNPVVFLADYSASYLAFPMTEWAK